MILVPEIRDPVIRISSTNYTLVNAVIDLKPDSLEAEEVKSCIDGTYDMIYKGKRLAGEINVQGLTLTNYSTILGAERTVVRLWPFGTGAITGTSPEKFYPWVDVVLSEVRPYHDQNRWYIDACIIRFVSQKYYTLERATSLGWTET